MDCPCSSCVVRGFDGAENFACVLQFTWSFPHFLWYRPSLSHQTRSARKTQVETDVATLPMALRDVKTCHRHHDHHDHHLCRHHLRRLRSKYLNAHHAAMTSMLHMQLASVQAAFATKRRHFACLHDVLDEATEQLTTET